MIDDSGSIPNRFLPQVNANANTPSDEYQMSDSYTVS